MMMSKLINRMVAWVSVKFTDEPLKPDRTLTEKQYTAAQRIDTARRKPSIKRSITK